MESRKKRKNKIFAVLKCYRITVWLIIASLGLAVTGTLCAYKYQQYAKMVAKIDSNVGLQFSSNYLEQQGYSTNDTILDVSEYTNNAKYIYYNSSSNDLSKLTLSFNVCNYPQNNPTSFNQSDITYDLYAMVVPKSGYTVEDLEGYECTLQKSDEQNVVTVSSSVTDALYKSKTLATDDGSCSHSYKLVLDKNIADKAEIIVEVIPVESSLSSAGNYKLCRKFTFSQNSEQETGWTGSFLENNSTTEYWAYNYLMSGTKNTTVRLMWNEKYISLSDWWIADLIGADNTSSDVTSEDIAKYKLTDNDGDKWKYIEFQAGKNGVTSYQLQFYRVTENTSNEQPDSSWIMLAEINSETDDNDTDDIS